MPFKVDFYTTIFKNELHIKRSLKNLFSTENNNTHLLLAYGALPFQKTASDSCYKCSYF